MAEVKLSKERMDYTIDLLIAMVVEEIAEETGKDRKDILIDFLSSKTGKFLYDETTKLWWSGPSYIAEMYMQEVNKQ
ncbi:hypothetical protein [Catenibacterium mitsuokai]|jgi:hypothetical protein|uniref:hypothetical protein n=2 Tax=Catenibacterium mitsuokai TaxID=100886 RepID=UPI001C037E2A|nr:hypothetical protein [Catenibacterium mitsuokai]MBT9814734.1 hypothetical protein [Catenibacterium mitsuokai]MEE0334037.1 hypothetical protein [Catenibacterium mitsuokai]